jgi:DNA-binding NarL/FixJ family response regulator
MSISVLIVDDYEVVRDGLVALLADPEIEVVGQAATGAEALRLAAQIHPQIVMLDVRMPDIDGFQIMRQIAELSPDSHIVVLSAFDNPTYVARAVTLGASDYILKGARRDEMISSIKAIARGDRSRHSALWRKIEGILRSASGVALSHAELTVREAQVLRHLALGLSNKEIGLSLDISIETVKEHVQNILRKMHVVDRTRAAVEAVKHGLV